MKKKVNKEKKKNKLAVCTKKDLVEAIASQFPAIKKPEIKAVLEVTCNEILKEIRQDKKVVLKNFGVYLPVQRKTRVGNILKEGKKVQIPARKQFVFKPAKLIKYID